MHASCGLMGGRIKGRKIARSCAIHLEWPNSDLDSACVDMYPSSFGLSVYTPS